MSETCSYWRILPQDAPVTAGTGVKKAVFAPAEAGMLRLKMADPLPEGQLILIATTQSRTVHWYQDAQRDGQALRISMEGFSEAVRACPEQSWRLELGRRSKQRIVTWTLSGGNQADYYKNAERYFLDDRAHYWDPVSVFSYQGAEWEVVPNLANARGALSLQIAPKGDRYIRQLTCRLVEIAVSGNQMNVAVQMPKTAPQPVGIALRGVNGAGETDERWFPVSGSRYEADRTVYGAVPLEDLGTVSGRWQLTCVLKQENGTLLHLSPHLLDGELATRLLEQYGPRPSWTTGSQGVYLSLSEDFLLEIQSASDMPGAQSSLCTSLEDFVAQGSLQGRCACEHLGGENWQWRLRLPGRDLTDMDEAAVVMHQLRSHKHYRCPITVERAGEEGCVISADLSCLIGTVENCLRDNFHAYIAFRKGTSFWYMPLHDPRHTFYGRKRRPTSYFNWKDSFFAEPVGETPFAGHSVEACPWWDWNGQTCLKLADACLRYHPYFVCRAEKAVLHLGALTMKIRCPKNVDGRWVGLMICHRYKLEEDRREYFVPLTRLQEGKEYDLLTVKASLKKLEYTPVYWDLRAVFEKDGKRFWVAIKPPKGKQESAAQRLKARLKGLFAPNTTNIGPKNQLFLCVTSRNRYALIYQEKTQYSGLAFRMKEHLAYLIYCLNRNRLRAENIMLTYEKYCCMAQDNGFYFFQYCMENNMEEKLNHKIYYIITPDSADYDNVRPYEDHVIPFMSLKHMVYLLACRLMVSSDSKPHAYAWRCKESIILPIVEQSRRLVFLQHGVIAMKKVAFFDASTNAVSLFVTSNRRERDIIVRELGYPPGKVIITGLTRWDVLRDRSDEVEGNHILVMPTWRNWLEDVGDEAFRASDYYQNYMALLNSQRWQTYLESHDAYLDFYIHPKFRDYIGDFSTSGQRIRLIPFGSEPLNRLIMQCKMLITDYSSVCWDVFYQGKPCIFYQFDFDKYNEAQGAYIDLEKDLFGDRALDNDTLFALLEEAAERNFQLKPKYAEMRLTSYEYLDHNNSQRVCEEIKRRNW